MLKLKILILSLTLLLASCGSAPHVSNPPAIVPQMPQIQAPALEPSFLERMENFLQGKLPEQKVSLENEITTTNNMKTQENDPQIKLECMSLAGKGRLIFKINEEFFVIRIDCPYGEPL